MQTIVLPGSCASHGSDHFKDVKELLGVTCQLAGTAGIASDIFL